MSELAALALMLVPVLVGYTAGRFAPLPAPGPWRLAAGLFAAMVGGVLLWGGVGTAQAGSGLPAVLALAFGGLGLGVAASALRRPA